MTTIVKSWQDAAESVVENIFDSFYAKQFESVSINASNMICSFDYVLSKTNGLTDLSDEALMVNEGFPLWKSLSHYAISSLRAIGRPIDKESMVNTLVSKQRDYGPNNIARFGTAGILIRIHDKIARLLNLLDKSDNNFNTAMSINAVEGESIVDTLIDIIGYSVVAIMWSSVDEETGLPEFLFPLV